MAQRRAYPSDVTDMEWEFVAPYLVLVREDAPQRDHALRDVFNALRYLIKTGYGWRYLPHDLPPWPAVYQQWARWRDNRYFEHMMADLRELARVLAGREAEPTAVILDSRTVQSTPESGASAGCDGAKRRKGSTVHVAALCERVQQVTGQKVQVVYTDQGYTGEEAEYAAAVHDIDLQVIAKPEGQTGFVLLPRLWAVERSFGWAARFRRLARDYERSALTLQQFNFSAFATLLLAKGVFLAISPYTRRTEEGRIFLLLWQQKPAGRRPTNGANTTKP